MLLSLGLRPGLLPNETVVGALAEILTRSEIATCAILYIESNSINLQTTWKADAKTRAMERDTVLLVTKLAHMMFLGV